MNKILSTISKQHTPMTNWSEGYCARSFDEGFV